MIMLKKDQRKVLNTLKKYKYRLNNLDCANCANKIEERLKKESNLSDVVVNFSSLTLSFMSNDDIKIEDKILNVKFNVVGSGFFDEN